MILKLMKYAHSFFSIRPRVSAVFDTVYAGENHMSWFLFAVGLTITHAWRSGIWA